MCLEATDGLFCPVPAHSIFKVSWSRPRKLAASGIVSLSWGYLLLGEENI